MIIKAWKCPYCNKVKLKNNKDFEKHLLENDECRVLFHESNLTCNHVNVNDLRVYIIK